MAEFAKLEASGHKMVEGMIAKCTKLVQQFHEEMDRETQAMEEDEDLEDNDATEDHLEALDAPNEASEDSDST